MFARMRATALRSDAPSGTCRQVIRRIDGEIELVDLRWGLEPREPGAAPWRFVRVEGREFPTHRCLIPASEFHIRRGDREYRVTLDDGNWFYLAGVWQPATDGWPGSFAVITVPANPEVARYQSRQGAVIRRNRHMAWLELTQPEAEQLQALPRRSFVVEPINRREPAQPMLAF